MSYADMLKKIRTSRDMEGVGGTIHSITKTKDGNLRIVLNREAAEIENLQIAIKTTIGNEASCTRLTDRATVEIRDADEEATNEEILQALEAHNKGQGTARIISKRRINRGLAVDSESANHDVLNATALGTRPRIALART